MLLADPYRRLKRYGDELKVLEWFCEDFNPQGTRKDYLVQTIEKAKKRRDL